MRARQWIEIEPEDSEGWEMLLEAGFSQNDHKTTAEALFALENSFGRDYSGEKSSVNWANF